MDFSERRSSLRGVAPFNVRFRVLSFKEYGTEKERDREKLFLHSGPYMAKPLPGDERERLPIPNASLLDFLYHVDEKLDRIISLLSGEAQESYDEGQGIDIGSLGMRLRLFRAVGIGQILHARFCLPTLPFVPIHVFGEVVHVTSSLEQTSPVYDTGIRFLDLDPIDKERIISHLFQCERIALRKRSNKEEICEQPPEKTE
jgi:hypothetical protein